MWENFGTSAVTLIATVIGALLARGSSQWRKLTTARHELELADAFGTGELAEELHAKAERSTRRYLDAGTVNPTRALWYSRIFTVAAVMTSALIALVALDAFLDDAGQWDKVIIVGGGVVLGFWFDPMAERVSKALFSSR